MHTAGQALDRANTTFSAFRAAECQARHPIRTLLELTVQRRTAMAWRWRWKRTLFCITWCAISPGSYWRLASGDQPVEWAQEVLERRDRTQAGVTAPADGSVSAGGALSRAIWFANHSAPPLGRYRLNAGWEPIQVLFAERRWCHKSRIEQIEAAWQHPTGGWRWRCARWPEPFACNKRIDPNTRTEL
jgi:hypothetical protein